MNDYSYNDMLRMQNEAKQRVLEMQKRSKNIAENFNGKAQKNDEQPKKASIFPDTPKAISYPVELPVAQGRQRKQAHPLSQARNSFDFPAALSNAFGNISDEDCEKMLVLSLCLLLTNEHADDSLVLALMYLLT